MPREIADNFYWIQECGADRSSFVTEVDGPDPAWYDEDEELHIGQCAYLFTGEQSLLFDSLSPASSERIISLLENLLDGDKLDYLAVSHPDVPHAGNTARILREYPEATLVAPKYGTGHELYHLDDAMHVSEGDTIDLGQYTVAFHEATFLDAALHMWMSELETNTLFPVDWFGYPHTGSECRKFADEFDYPITPDRLMEFQGRVLFWHQYVDVGKVNAEIERLIEKYDPNMLAPAHGNVVRKRVPEHMRLVKQVVQDINRVGRVGTLG